MEAKEIRCAADYYPPGWCPIDGSMKVDGWEYFCYEFIEGKKDHVLVNRERGVYVEIDWSPYSRMYKSQVRQWLSLGGPKRHSTGPLCQDDLDELQKVVEDNLLGDAL